MSISRAFPKVRNSGICPKFLMGSKFYFFPIGKHIFPNSLKNFGNLRKWNILFIMFGLKCGQPCVNSPPYFQQWNLNQEITFPNSSTDSKSGLRNLGFRLHFQVFPHSQRDHKLRFLNVTVAGLLNFSQFMEEIENQDFSILA